MIKYVAFVVLGRQSVDNNTDPSALRTDRIGDGIGDYDDRRDPLAPRERPRFDGRFLSSDGRKSWQERALRPRP